MEPISFLLVTIAVVFIARITYNTIVNWFRSRHRIAEEDHEAIGVLIAERLDNQQYKTVEGVFRRDNANTRLVQAVYNERTGTVYQARALESNNAPDAQVRGQLEEGNGMVIYR
ncbi:MAG: hypothetical protein ABSB59_11395 [Streptosporangiaceae bacterium]|jgi:DNA-directed RNA polymerase specialized sigma24 family protein